MQTYAQLKRAVKDKDGSAPHIHIAVVGDTATQFLATAIEGYGVVYGFYPVLFDAEYDSIDAQLLDGCSEVYLSAPEYIILYISTQKLYEGYLECSEAARVSFAEGQMAKIEGYWQCIKKYSKAKIIQYSFTEMDDGVFGNYAGKVQHSFLYQIRKMNVLFMDCAKRYGNVYPAELGIVQNQIGIARMFDSNYFYSAKVAISLDALPYAAKLVWDVINALRGNV